MLQRPKEQVMLAALSGKRLPADCGTTPVTETRYGEEGALFFVPDSMIWSKICSTRLGFVFFGKRRLRGLLDAICVSTAGKKVVLFVHKPHVFISMCAVARTIVDERVCEWTELRIMILNCRIDIRTINRGCNIHRVPLGIIADSRFDPKTDPDREVRRLFLS
ncbi:MAG TPA: hypothetical protein PKA63_00145 [Oligoflexia bacterium]|nr:hypothetical protein [Oligoflexia bacterium]HMP47058.1 hypothetical protein [Oligoflexia bacterium]